MAEIPDEVAPSNADERHEDREYNVAIEPDKAKAWLNLLRESEKAFEDWYDCCDNIERQYANLERLRNMSRDKEFAMCWANLETLKPAIYAKPPVPVVVPKFKDRRPLYTTASEVMERCCVIAFDVARVHDVMLLVRDDLAMVGRGVVWCRYDPAEDDRPEYVCLDYKHRCDFLHSLSRNWREVTWVAAASYLTRAQARKRFKEFSGDEYQQAEYRVDKDAKEIGGGDSRERAKFWEIWHRGLDRVVWVAEGCENVLDDAEPHVRFTNFFPCPCPAYATTQPGSLIPVPDMLQYKDQIDEVNTLTGRIHALSEAIEAKGFYPAGVPELGDAVEAAVKMKSNSRVLVPISNWAAFGGTKEVVIWLPIDMIGTCITALVQLRKQVIDDIYQIMGLSDIMRGATDPQETLGAQQIKSQYGASRVRDKQQELVRLARDLVEITAEIIASEFSPQTVISMCQMQIPSERQQQQKVQTLQQQLQQQQQQVQQKIQSVMAQAKQNPKMLQQLQQNPQAAQQLIQAATVQLQQMEDQIRKEMMVPTFEQIMRFIKDYRTTSFVLDIETDSTIQADENAEKQRRGEFMGMLATLMPQLSQMVAARPQTAAFAGELLKFAVAPFRAGRSLDTAIDDLVAQVEAAGKAGQQQPNPEEAKIKALVQIEEKKIQSQEKMKGSELKLKQQEMQAKHQVELQKAQNDKDIAMAEIQGRQSESAARVEEVGAKVGMEREKHEQKMREGQQKMVLNVQSVQQKQMDAQQRQQDAAYRRAQQDRAQVFKERQAAMKPLGGPPA